MALTIITTILNLIALCFQIGLTIIMSVLFVALMYLVANVMKEIKYNWLRCVKFLISLFISFVIYVGLMMYMMYSMVNRFDVIVESFRQLFS